MHSYEHVISTSASLWHRIQNLGLAVQSRRVKRLKKIIRKVMALGHLPLAFVRQNFRMLVERNSTRHLINRFPALQDFLDYVERNYLDGNFPPALWNVFNRDSDTRTNNHIEGRPMCTIIVKLYVF
jgi:hypothetical protein